MIFTRKQAKMIAEELFTLIRSDIKEVSKEVQLSETEEYLTMKEAAAYLNINYYTLQKRKDNWGCYVKVGKKILFPKTKLNSFINAGVL